MKSLAAILFLVILVFNFYGYRLVISCMQDNTIVAIESQVDKKQYSDDELISFKTTLNLAYYTSSSAYERAYGSVTIDGKDYEYVKRRVYNDTLELLCLPNHSKTKLQTINNDLAKSLADGQSSPDKKNSNVVKLSLPDFCQQEKTHAYSFVLDTKQSYFLSNTHFSLSRFRERQERPPQSIQCINS